MTKWFTKRDINQASSPACSPQYMVNIPAGTECEPINLPLSSPHRYVIKDISKVSGSNQHDLHHYYVWIDASEIEEKSS